MIRSNLRTALMDYPNKEEVYDPGLRLTVLYYSEY